MIELPADTTANDVGAASEVQEQMLQRPPGVAGAVRGFIDRVRGGDLGLLPVIAGLVVICTVLQISNSIFLSSPNLVNLVDGGGARRRHGPRHRVRAARRGDRPVRRIGEWAVGSHPRRAVRQPATYRCGSPSPRPSAAGVAIGLVYAAVFNRIGIPSFVITLAGLLAFLGLQLKVLGKAGSINIPFDSGLVQFAQTWFVPAWLSYVFVGLAALSLFVTGYMTSAARRAAGLAGRSTAALLVRSATVLVGVGFAVWYLNRARGVGWMFAFFVGLVLIVNYALTRTKWGKTMFAVGGNEEAARRAGINVRSDLRVGVRPLLDTRRGRRHSRGSAAGVGQPGERRRRRQPQRHRRRRDRRNEPLRRSRQRLVGTPRHHRHPGDLQRPDTARPRLCLPLHRHRGGAAVGRRRRLDRPPFALFARPLSRPAQALGVDAVTVVCVPVDSADHGCSYTELLPLGPDDTQYRLIATDGVSTVDTALGTFLTVTPEAITMLTAEAMNDIAHFLRPGHLAQLRRILDDPEASDNDRFVALDLLKNAAVAAGGVLPMCQDTGTAIVKAKKGQFVMTGGGDEAAIAAGVQQTYVTANLRYSQMAPLTMYDERNTGTNLPAEIKITSVDGDIYKFLFIAKGGGSANKSYLFQETKALLNEATLLPWLFDKLQMLGTAACPPYHLAVAIGGTSAEFALETAKLASTHYLDPLPTAGSPAGHGFRDVELEGKVLQLAQRTGIGAQFGGKYFCHDVRIVRLPRHGASCPVAIAVSCSADRQALGKITRDGVFLEQLERDPARFLPDVSEEHLDEATVVSIDLARPMAEIRAELSRHPVRTRVMLTGPMVVARDIAHAKIKERLDAGEEMPQYLRDHCVYYAGPAKTPEGYASGSFGPTTAGRMDSYVDQFQAAGGSLVMLAKGNRSPQVTAACKAHERLLPRLDRRPGCPPGARQHHAGRGARVPRAGHGGGVEDRRRRLPRVHRRRRQGQRLLRTGSPRGDGPARLDLLTPPRARIWAASAPFTLLGGGELCVAPAVVLEAVAMLVVELPTIALEDDRCVHDADVHLVADDDRMELDGGKAEVLDEALHQSLQITVEQLAVGEPVVEGGAKRRHPRTTAPRMDPHGGRHGVGRHESVRHDVADGGVDTRRVDGADVAEHAHDLARRDVHAEDGAEYTPQAGR